MKYAEQIRDTYFENKDRIAKHRKELMLCGILTLQHKLDDTYDAYKRFCGEVGTIPKKKGEFLRSTII